MFCRNCGEENPDNAVFCRNCGERLEKEEIKKAEVIEKPVNTHHEQSTTTSTSSSNDNDWVNCCICIVVVFIVFGIFGTIFHL